MDRLGMGARGREGRRECKGWSFGFFFYFANEILVCVCLYFVFLCCCVFVFMCEGGEGRRRKGKRVWITALKIPDFTAVRDEVAVCP